MPSIGESIVLNSTSPNFARDKVATKAELKSARSSRYDVGHIVYCSEDGHHYKYLGTNGTYDEEVGYFGLFGGSGDSESISTSDLENILG